MKLHWQNLMVLGLFVLCCSSISYNSSSTFDSEDEPDCSWVYGNHTDCSACQNNEPIDVCGDNAPAELLLLQLREQGVDTSSIIIVPGETLDFMPEREVTDIEKISLHLAVEEFNRVDPQPALIVVSGGNIHPSGTPYNEVT